MYISASARPSKQAPTPSGADPDRTPKAGVAGSNPAGGTARKASSGEVFSPAGPSPFSGTCHTRATTRWSPGPDGGRPSVRRGSAETWSIVSGAHRACPPARPSSRSGCPRPGGGGYERSSPTHPGFRKAPPSGPLQARSEQQPAAPRPAGDAFSCVALASAQHRQLRPWQQGHCPSPRPEAPPPPSRRPGAANCSRCRLTSPSSSAGNEMARTPAADFGALSNRRPSCNSA